MRLCNLSPPTLLDKHIGQRMWCSVIRSVRTLLIGTIMNDACMKTAQMLPWKALKDGVCVGDVPHTNCTIRFEPADDTFQRNNLLKLSCKQAHVCIEESSKWYIAHFAAVLPTEATLSKCCLVSLYCRVVRKKCHHFEKHKRGLTACSR